LRSADRRGPKIIGSAHLWLLDVTKNRNGRVTSVLRTEMNVIRTDLLGSRMYSGILDGQSPLTLTEARWMKGMCRTVILTMFQI